MILFDLIKNNDIDKIIKIINNIDFDSKTLNAKDENNNYFIHYVINTNNIELLKLCLSKNINLEVLDSDNRNIFFTPLKFNQLKTIELLINRNKNLVGSSIIEYKDKFGLSSLHYTVIFNNIKLFTLLLETSADLYSTNNQGYNVIMSVILYNRIDMLKYIISKNYRLNVYSQNNESLLQIALNSKNMEAIELLLDKDIDINNKENEYGLCLLHQAIISNNHILFTTLLNYKDIDINQQDYYGNTVLHYIFIEKKYKFLKELFEHEIMYNYTNYNGDIALHLLLTEFKMDDNNYLDIMIKNSDLNLQNNQGVTCLMLLLDNDLLITFTEILSNKSLNFYIEDNEKNKMKINDDIINLSVESYYNQLLANNNANYSLDWEKWCANNVLDKLQKISKLTNVKDICKEKIKKLIVEEKRTLPKIFPLDLKLDNGIFTNTCYYTGFPIDILFGILVLIRDFSSLGVVLSHPLTVNTKLQEYYEKIGTDYPYKLEFCNIEIIWSYQKLFYPSYFDSVLQENIKNYDYIVIPIGIELSTGAHANIIFIDKKNKTIERFEPNGASSPIGFNYNPELLDTLLKNKFASFFEDYKYYKPSEFLPLIGFQMLENIESNRCKRIGDPNGFCGVWSTWWVYQRMLNIENIEMKVNNIAFELIKFIKLDNLKFKNIIRNFSSKITELRDAYLEKYKLDINDWVVGNYTEENISNLEKDIFRLLSS